MKKCNIVIALVEGIITSLSFIMAFDLFVTLSLHKGAAFRYTFMKGGIIFSLVAFIIVLLVGIFDIRKKRNIGFLSNNDEFVKYCIFTICLYFIFSILFYFIIAPIWIELDSLDISQIFDYIKYRT